MVSRAIDPGEGRPVSSRTITLAGAVAIVAVFVVGLALYVRTLLPDVAFWDTGEFQTIGPVLGISHPTGYPTFTLLSWLASVVLQPFGNPAFRADLLAGLFGAGAAALTALVVILLTRRAVLGLAAGLALAVSPLGWDIALAADPHALHIFLTALLLALLVTWQMRRRTDPERAGRWLVAAAVVFGLSLGNHALTLLLAPGVGVFVLLTDPWLPVRRWKLALACVAALVVTTVAVYAYIPIRAAMKPPLNYADPVTWERFKYVVLGEQFQGTFHPLPSLSGGITIVWEQLRQNLGLGAWLAAAGAVLGTIRHLPFMVLTAIWFLFTFVFALGYENAAIQRYYLVPLMVSVIWAALAADAVWSAVESAFIARLPARGGTPGPETEPAAPVPTPSGRTQARTRLLVSALVAAVLLVPILAPVPHRLGVVDRSDETSPRAWMEATFTAVERDAVIVSWWNYSTALWYGRWVEGLRPDVTIIDDRTILDEGYGTAQVAIDRFIGSRPVYLIRLDRDLAQFRKDYVLQQVAGIPSQPSGTVYRVLPAGA
jgi:hypothetical protein